MNTTNCLHNAFDWRNIRLNLLICSGISILLTFILWQQHPNAFWQTFFICSVYSFSIGFSVYFFMIVVNIKTNIRWLNYIITFLLICCGTLIGVIIATSIFSIVYKTNFMRIDYTGIIYLLFSGVFFTLVAITIFHYFHLSENRKYKYLEEQEQKAKAELRALVSQINPHFLFNTLNSISSLIHMDPDQADEMVQKLSDVFRYSLLSGKKQYVSIKEELIVVKKYLEIEKVRFAERLQYIMDIDESCLQYSIPPLILQTIVENSVKHGISPKIYGGRVTISIKSYNKDNIAIQIKDNGLGLPDDFKEGFGLNAVKNILKLQFEKHEFIINNKNGVQVDIIIPKKEVDDEN